MGSVSDVLLLKKTILNKKSTVTGKDSCGSWEKVTFMGQVNMDMKSHKLAYKNVIKRLFGTRLRMRIKALICKGCGIILNAKQVEKQ